MQAIDEASKRAGTPARKHEVRDAIRIGRLSLHVQGPMRSSSSVSSRRRSSRPSPSPEHSLHVSTEQPSNDCQRPHHWLNERFQIHLNDRCSSTRISSTGAVPFRFETAKTRSRTEPPQGAMACTRAGKGGRPPIIRAEEANVLLNSAISGTIAMAGQLNVAVGQGCSMIKCQVSRRQAGCRGSTL